MYSPKEGGEWEGEIAGAGGEQKLRAFNVLGLGRGTQLPHTATVAGLVFSKPPSLKYCSDWSSIE